MKALQEDTLMDKLVRFVIGALFGGAMSFTTLLFGPVWDETAFLKIVAAMMLLMGVASIALGNRFIEKSLPWL